MKISVVIPNYNGSKLLKANLSKVLSAVEEAEVIVVDDASTDGSIEEIKNLISRFHSRQELKIIRNDINLGFASTVNKGVKEATGELIVLLNTDVVPEENFLDKAILHFQDSKVFAVGFLQKCLEEGKVILRGRGVGKFERGFLFHSRGAVSGKDTSDGVRMHSAEVEDFRKTLWVSGGAGIYSKKIWQELGGMDSIYNPFYWEDIDLSYRALKAGYKLVFEPRSIVIHNQEKGAIRSLYTPQQVKTIAYRNQILFVWLNITSYSLLLNHFLYLPYHLLNAVLSGNSSFIKAFLLAFFRIRKVLSGRTRNNKEASVTDEKILSDLNL